MARPIGIPYAWTDPQTGARTCPACGLIIPEDYTAGGEPASMNYAEHYLSLHDTGRAEEFYRTAAAPHGTVYCRDRAGRWWACLDGRREPVDGELGAMFTQAAMDTATESGSLIPAGPQPAAEPQRTVDLGQLAEQEAAQTLALVLGAEPGSVLSALPDGRDDRPDEHGRHTKTANVTHSAAEYARFTGCPGCRAMAAAEARAHNGGFHGHYGRRWEAAHPGVPNAHMAADCPDGYRPASWRPGFCYCETCRIRRDAIGF